MMEATGACLGARQFNFTLAYRLRDGCMLAIREDGTKFLCKNTNDIEDIEADETRKQEQRNLAYLKK